MADNHLTSDPEPKGVVMGALLKEIHLKYKRAAAVLTKAGFETDIDIRSLTREDLHRLFPRVQDLRLTKQVFNIIHQPRPASMLLKELREMQNVLASSAQTVVVGRILCDAIVLLTKINTSQLESRADKGSLSETSVVNAQGAEGVVMGALLKEIKLKYKHAAAVLRQAGFETDIDIRSLTREDLHELFPGAKDLRLRKQVFKMIHKPTPASMLLKELRELQNSLGSSAQTDPGLHTDHIDFIKSQMTIVQIILRDNIDLLKNINTSQPAKADKGSLSETRGGHSQGAQGVVMGALLKEIQLEYKRAAAVLTEAGFETDEDIRSLTREDLHELFPRVEDLRLRKQVFNMIHKPRPANMLLKELRELQNNLASSAQTDPGLHTDHIDFMKSQLTIVHILLNDNIDLLKNINTSQLESKADKDSIPETSAQDAQEAPVTYNMVVGGQTFGAHEQLMKKVNRGTNDSIQFVENPKDSHIIIVFCPITAESDVKAAMSGVPGDKRVILVKMHHVYESKSSLCFNTSVDDRNIVLQVNVFYHENVRGLLNCQLNETAVSEIQQELLKHSNHRSQDASASTSIESIFGFSFPWINKK